MMLMRSRTPWVKLLIAALIGYSLAHVGYSVVRYNPLSSPYVSGDFRRVFEEMQRWRATGTLDQHEVLYPPLYYVLLLPLAHLEFTSVVHLLYFSQFLWYVLAVLLMAKIVAEGPAPSAMEYLLASLLTANFQPFLETVAMHKKVEGLEFFLICLAIYLFKQRRDVFAGAVVVFAANLKYLPGILVLYFLAKREVRAIAGMVIALAVCLAVSIVAVSGEQGEWATLVAYPAMLLLGRQHEGNRPEASIEFQTLSGTVNRWFVGPDGMMAHFKTQSYVPVSHPELAFGFAALLKLMFLAVYLFVVRRRSPPQVRQAQWPVALYEFSVTLVMAFVIAPASRVHYAILLLPAFVFTGLLLYRYQTVLGWPQRLLFGLSYALAAMLVPGGLLNRLPPHPLWGPYHSFAYLWFSLPFYGYLLLGGCVLWCRARLQPSL
jgi:hypothetical protein